MVVIPISKHWLREGDRLPNKVQRDPDPRSYTDRVLPIRPK